MQEEEFSDTFFEPSDYELQIREKTLTSAKLLNSMDIFDVEEKNVKNESQEEFITVEDEVDETEEVAQAIGEEFVKVSNDVHTA